ncbi:MAG: NADH-quinone oxidoreductase subunit C [Deltaproteobacteria bacterium]|jgi:NADH-quinone oxidoreductase subunit C|nr:NADH-quinone oxidoreductase subunit C [Deltaproteobacteria bacterium]
MTRAELVKNLQALPGAVVSDTDHKARGFDLDVKLSPENIAEAVQLMDEAGYFLDTMTGVDWLGEQEALRKEADKGKAAAPASESAAGEPPLPQAGIGEDEIEIVYDFNNFQEPYGVVLRVRTPRAKPEVPSIHHIYPIAHWHEREAHEFFGVVFTGHPYLVPLLLPEDADYHPLLKDFVA